jgi:hypothetical protein
MEANEEFWRTGALLTAEGKKKPKRRRYLFINKCFEGNAILTIMATPKPSSGQ